MSDDGLLRLYAGDGSTIGDRKLQLPLFARASRLDSPEYYLAEKGLRDAVNVALALRQPLLVTGEPGTGKTQLAASVAHELNLPAPLVFHAKTTSTARDLFYRYDALRHFHDSHFQKEAALVEAYITYEALGLAILRAMDPAQSAPFLPEEQRSAGPLRSVILIDEIDKAPKDLPNDVLNEIEQMAFTVKETGRAFAADQRFRPILILTSNLEKQLPDAFLRRCVFYHISHISFPDDRERLKAIVERRLEPDDAFTSEMLDHALSQFGKLRELRLAKPPATAECLAWLQILQRLRIDVDNLKQGQAEALAFSYSVLAKTKEDLRKMQQTVAGRTEGS